MILVMALLGIFVFSAWSIGKVLYQYQVSDQLYENAADRFTSRNPGAGQKADSASDTWKNNMAQNDTLENDTSGNGAEGAGNGEAGWAGNGIAECGAPITVDFEGLREVTEDVIGWIYCEGTAIHYPVLKGRDNDTYLRHAYDGSYSEAGCIFIEERNRPGFADANTIIYGHNMNDGSMFADLKKWAEEDFYKEHPVIWLLTPEQNYVIELFSCYVTSGYSETYTIFTGPCPELDEYLKKCAEQSAYRTEVELDPEAGYVLLSTCSYVFEDARTVLHGKLTPVDD